MMFYELNRVKVHKSLGFHECYDKIFVNMNTKSSNNKWSWSLNCNFHFSRKIYKQNGKLLLIDFWFTSLLFIVLFIVILPYSSIGIRLYDLSSIFLNISVRNFFLENNNLRRCDCDHFTLTGCALMLIGIDRVRLVREQYSIQLPRKESDSVLKRPWIAL